MSNKTKVLIYVQNGCIQDVICNDNNVEVELRDYDVEGMEMEQICEDEDGDQFALHIWEDFNPEYYHSACLEFTRPNENNTV